MVSQLAKFEKTILEKELELKTLQEYLGDNDSRVVRLKKQIEQTRGLMHEFKTGFKDYSAEYPPLDIVPDLMVEYSKYELELRIQGTIYKMLREQYEAARIEEADKSLSLYILEEPEIPEKKFGPSRSFIMILSVFAFFSFGIIISLIREKIKKMKLDPEEAEKLENIKKSLKLFKK
jgi:uncharacterized protein involved in exopolysaccharide biosynthesis